MTWDLRESLPLPISHAIIREATIAIGYDEG